MTSVPTDAIKTFSNPVYNHPFPDPFVLKFRGEYYAFCTGRSDDGRAFGVLQSHDLVEWSPRPGAMRPLDPDHPHYWAPEVTYLNGKFYLYYSVGNETLMETRVAVSDRPDGEYVDSGKRLTTQDFAIDAHVFRDNDGILYMFYATDFLDHSHIGTGTVVDRMLDPFTLAGDPRPVTRARFDWQIYDPQRKEKGGVRWHTVEGPFVLKRKGTYYEIFSGGNWQNVSYGVSFAVTHDLNADAEWTQQSDGEKTLPILRTIRDRVLGPGHNSVVRGPNNREMYCVYHEWTEHGRVLAIDRMDYAGGDRLFIAGPSYEPQALPYHPKVFDDGNLLASEIVTVVSGGWSNGLDGIVSTDPGPNELTIEMPAESFLCEVNAKRGDGLCGIELKSGKKSLLKFTLDVNAGHARVKWSEGKDWSIVELPADHDPRAFHLLRVEVDCLAVKLSLNDVDVLVTGEILEPATHLSLVSEGSGSAFSAFTLTAGFEQLFENDALPQRGWSIEAGDVRVASGNLILESSEEAQTRISKKVPEGDFDLAVNLCVTKDSIVSMTCGASFTLSGMDFRSIDSPATEFRLPEKFDSTRFSQFRFVKIGDRLTLYLEGDHLGEFSAPEANRLGLTVQNGTVTFDMIRFTLI